jgi:hypothetical protein
MSLTLSIRTQSVSMNCEIFSVEQAPPATDEHEGKTLVLKKRDEEDFWAGTGGSKGKKGLKTGRRPSAPAADDAKAKVITTMTTTAIFT